MTLAVSRTISTYDVNEQQQRTFMKVRTEAFSGGSWSLVSEETTTYLTDAANFTGYPLPPLWSSTVMPGCKWGKEYTSK